MDIDAALQSQIRNIETTYGRPLDHWFAARAGLRPLHDALHILTASTPATPANDSAIGSAGG